MSLATFTPTKNYGDGIAWTKAIMDAFVDPLATFINTNIAGALPDKTGTDTITGSWTFSQLAAFTSGIKLVNNALQRSDGSSWTLISAGAQNFVGDSATQTLTNKTIQPVAQDGLLLPINAPTAGTGSVAFANNQILVWDGSAVRTYINVEKSPTTIHNLGLKLSAGALSVTGLGNVALAANNSGWVAYPSSTAGVWLCQPITADQTISSGGIKGRWGTTASIAWGSDMPMAIGVTSKDDTAAGIRFFITRNQAMTITPSNLNNIGIDGTAPVTSDQSNIVLFGSTVNTGYNNRPCRIIGAFRITIDNSAGGVATVTALDNGDGINNFYNFGTRELDYPLNQNGAAVGTPMLANGGTAPVFTTNILKYTPLMSGHFWYSWRLDADGGADGAGAVSAKLTMPYTTTAAPVGQFGISEVTWANGANSQGAVFSRPYGGSVSIEFLRNPTATTSAPLLNSDFPAGARTINGNGYFKAFT